MSPLNSIYRTFFGLYETTQVAILQYLLQLRHFRWYNLAIYDKISDGMYVFGTNGLKVIISHIIEFQGVGLYLPPILRLQLSSHYWLTLDSGHILPKGPKAGWSQNFLNFHSSWFQVLNFLLPGSFLEPILWIQLFFPCLLSFPGWWTYPQPLPENRTLFL